LRAPLIARIDIMRFSCRTASMLISFLPLTRPTRR
jgi:hypothetical protein